MVISLFCCFYFVFVVYLLINCVYFDAILGLGGGVGRIFDGSKLNRNIEVKVEVSIDNNVEKKSNIEVDDEVVSICSSSMSDYVPKFKRRRISVLNYNCNGNSWSWKSNVDEGQFDVVCKTMNGNLYYDIIDESTTVIVKNNDVSLNVNVNMSSKNTIDDEIDDVVVINDDNLTVLSNSNSYPGSELIEDPAYEAGVDMYWQSYMDDDAKFMKEEMIKMKGLSEVNDVDNADRIEEIIEFLSEDDSSVHNLIDNADYIDKIIEFLSEVDSSVHTSNANTVNDAEKVNNKSILFTENETVSWNVRRKRDFQSFDDSDEKENEDSNDEQGSDCESNEVISDITCDCYSSDYEGVDYDDGESERDLSFIVADDDFEEEESLCSEDEGEFDI